MAGTCRGCGGALDGLPEDAQECSSQCAEAVWQQQSYEASLND